MRAQVVGHLENPSSRQLSSILDALRVSCQSQCPGLVADVQQVIGQSSCCSILSIALYLAVTGC